MLGGSEADKSEVGHNLAQVGAATAASIVDLAPKIQEGRSPISYENLNDYLILETKVNRYPANYVLRAKKLSTNEIWYLALRHGEFSAHVDKAVSEVFRKYVPRTPETALVKSNDDYYLASKEIAPTVEVEFEVAADERAEFYYYGFISVLSHYLGESDKHSGNVLSTAEGVSTFYGHKIDNAESLNEDALNNVEESSACSSDSEANSESEDKEKINENSTAADPKAFELEDILANHWNFKTSIVNHYRYKKEQLEMIHQISQAPFDEIGDLIRKYVRASNKEQAITFSRKMLEMDLSELEKDNIRKALSNEKSFDKTPEMGDLLNLLSKRHQRYQEIDRSIEAKKIKQN